MSPSELLLSSPVVIRKSELYISLSERNAKTCISTFENFIQQYVKGLFFNTTVRRILFLCVINLFISSYVFAQTDSSVFKWGNWQTWGDQGNGTYINPILPGDYSDLDCIRVGKDYYAISSTFQYSPGMVILHSKDLVNWKILSHAVDDITQISPEMNWDKMNRYGKGIWAGAIRYHNKKFWIYFGTPDEGYFMTSAKNPAGPWEPLHHILKEKGWDDCCPFWDDDGQAYFIGTNFGDGYKIHLFKISADGKELIKESDKIIYQSKGSEANKLYKINGMYYHFFSEVKKDGRAIMMQRSKSIYGPYTEVKQLSHSQKEFHEPNQGGMVQTQKGDWYFLTHHGSGGDWSGRIMSLLPVTWIDGWPIIGKAGADTIGTMVWRCTKPVKSLKIIAPQTNDEFNNSYLPPQWEWNYNPRKDRWSLTQKKGWLRLYAFKPIEQNNLLKAGNTLTQRSYRTAFNEVTIKIDISKMAEGQKAGLCHFGSPNYSSFGIEYDSVRFIAYNIKGVVTKGPVINANMIWLKSTWGLNGESRYFYSLDGITYNAFGDSYQLAWGAYRGDRIGIYNYNDKGENGLIDVDFFHYKIEK
ncbi:MAG: glycoside hydrolase 43 family protein [Chitinophagaceae bacterium]